MVVRTLDFAERLCCDHCGEDQAELRSYPRHGWTADEIFCAACFRGYDRENSFTDFPLMQAAPALPH